MAEPLPAPSWATATDGEARGGQFQCLHQAAGELPALVDAEGAR